MSPFYCHLVLFLTVSSTTEYYVRPTDSDHISCPVQYCPTINDVSEPSSEYLESNTILTFLPGNHTLIRPVDISNVKNITLQGNNDVHFQLASFVDSRVQCADIQNMCLFVVRIKNASLVTLHDITVTRTFLNMVAIWVDNCNHVRVKGMKVLGMNSGKGIGVQVYMSQDVLFDHLEIRNVRVGVFITLSNGTNLHNTVIEHSTYVGVNILLCHSLSFYQIQLTNNSRLGLSLSSSYNIDIVQVVSSLTEVGVKIDSSIDVTMMNMILTSHSGAAVNITNSNRSSMIGITTANNHQYGIYAVQLRNLSIENLSSFNDNIGVVVNSISSLSIKHLSTQMCQTALRATMCHNIKLSIFYLVENLNGISLDNCHTVNMDCIIVRKMNARSILVHSSYIINAFNISVIESTHHSMYITHSAGVVMEQVSLESKNGLSLYIAVSKDVVINQLTTVSNEICLFLSDSVHINDLLLLHNRIFVLQCSNVELENLYISSIERNGVSFLHCQNASITDSRFSEVVYRSFEPDTVVISAIVSSHNTTLAIINCTFTNNTVSSIDASDTTIHLEGVIKFQNISTESGAAFILSGESTVKLSEDSHVYFKGNHATDYGAAFYITTEEATDTSVYIKHFNSITPSQFDTPRTNCFLRVEGSRGDTPRFTFINNTAEKGGDVLYGGLVASGYDGDWNCLLSFKNISDMSRQSRRQPFKRITSEPSRVCLCQNQVPDCLIVVDPTVHSLYPGETLTLPLVVVGQDFGTVSGFVHGQFLNSSFVFYLEDQRYVSFKNGACSNINYTLYSSCDICEAVLVLTPNRQNISQYPGPNFNEKLRNTWSQLLLDGNYNHLAMKFIWRFITYQHDDPLAVALIFHREEYNRALTQVIEDLYISSPGSITSQTDFRLRFPIKIYQYPLYIHIVFKPCPLGFVLSESQCTCSSLLQQIPTVKCDIQTQTISHDGCVWVGLYDSNDTVAASQYCPLNYCKQKTARSSFQVPNSSDSQCNFRRSGVLCGGCQSGLSLALGSDQCLPCSNTYLLLILPFALAGLLVVFLIKSLDLTVCHGAINGIIFYANIINASKSILFSQSTNNPIPVFISWFNLDLGIEVCFYDGLTAYARTWLQFLFPFYIWSIAGGIIFLARYSERIAKFSGNTGVPVLSTLFLLSYAKLFNTIISVVSYTTLYTTDGPKLVWSSDGNIPYLGLKHAFLFVMAVSVLLFLWLPYTLLLLFGRQLHKINFYLLTRRLRPFLDANYAPLNSGHEYWFGVTLIVKATVLLASATVPANSTRVLVFSMAVACTSLLFSGYRVYTKSSIVFFHRICILNLLIRSITKLFLYNDTYSLSIVSDTLNVNVLIAFVSVFGIRVYKMLYPKLKLLWCASELDKDTEELFDLENYERNDELNIHEDDEESIDSNDSVDTFA